ncbi:MAG: hypothetical protein M1833_004769 [Piccolia ochrophora]|nr:MAG: hypothetical protein M1833_004769 [Piccolia ochrophora]
MSYWTGDSPYEGCLQARSLNGEGPGPVPFQHTLWPIIAAMAAVTWYNCFEISIQIWSIFRRRSGIYYWSLIATSAGIALLQIAHILKWLVDGPHFALYTTFIFVGWYGMIIGESLVLYSRLHLVIRNRNIIRSVLIMIVAGSITMLPPTTIFLFGSNSSFSEFWLPKFKIMERLQVTYFSLQEITITVIYIWAAVKLLSPTYAVSVRAVMTFFVSCMSLIILMDVGIVIAEFVNWYNIQAALKPFIYSIKLKLEFAFLNQLLYLARSGFAKGGMLGPDKQRGPGNQSDHRYLLDDSTKGTHASHSSGREKGRSGSPRKDGFGLALGKYKSEFESNPSDSKVSTKNWFGWPEKEELEADPVAEDLGTLSLGGYLVGSVLGTKIAEQAVEKSHHESTWAPPESWGIASSDTEAAKTKPHPNEPRGPDDMPSPTNLLPKSPSSTEYQTQQQNQKRPEMSAAAPSEDVIKLPMQHPQRDQDPADAAASDPKPDHDRDYHKMSTFLQHEHDHGNKIENGMPLDTANSEPPGQEPKPLPPLPESVFSSKHGKGKCNSELDASLKTLDALFARRRPSVTNFGNSETDWWE